VLGAALIGSVAVASALAGCAGGDSSDSARSAVDGCTAEISDRSIARIWDETALALIRQVVPAPTVHARNLFHLSAAMWDAWAAYDTVADGYFVTERHTADDVGEARRVAISYAAHRLLTWRYATVSDLATAAEQLDAVMASQCLRVDLTGTEGDDPVALGNRIAATIIESTADDGSLESDRYVDHAYRPRNDPLVVADPGTTMRDPNSWQPLSLGLQLSQNGILIPGNIQTFIGPHWGHVTPFAMAPAANGVPIDPGPPPRLDDPDGGAAYREAALDVLRYGAALDAENGAVIDIGPGSFGGNDLGTNDGSGHPENPATGEPYEPNEVLHGDFGRVIAEYWADGPESETPPGHWNVLANAVADAPGFERRLAGRGPVLDRLEWDVKTYFALNGAVHDAAIAAWGLKGHYDSVRPISMIRYLGGLGQSSDPDAAAYHPDGLPLEPGLVEVVTTGTSRPGERHEHLADHVGEVAVRAWLGAPDDPEVETTGVGWVPATEWMPYQRPTFVSPAFAGYVSGHSAFSRAAAEVLTGLTGSPLFPNGEHTWTVGAGTLLHEDGPTADVTLHWASYADAADQAGISRLYGGIHIPADDIAGRIIGAQCGHQAWELAQTYFAGTADP
jgi:hypothetical protein